MSALRIVRGMAVSEGAGVTVHRTIGTPQLRYLDPFLMLDHFASDNPNDYIAGFPDHPHRGFVTVTYMLDGHMLHEDSMGNRGDLMPGSIQWMKAASGIIHSEMPQQISGLMRGFQLWVNLPASQKMSPPAYQEFQRDAIPELNEGGATVRVLVGSHAGVQGPVSDPNTDMSYLHVTLPPGARWSHAGTAGHQGFAYLFEGDATLYGQALPRHTLVVLEGDAALELEAGQEGASLIRVAGRPIGEPIVQYGPFVMNTREEIQQAFDDYHRGRLVRQRASGLGG